MGRRIIYEGKASSPSECALIILDDVLNNLEKYRLNVVRQDSLYILKHDTVKRMIRQFCGEKTLNDAILVKRWILYYLTQIAGVKLEKRNSRGNGKKSVAIVFTLSNAPETIKTPTHTPR